MHVEPNPEQVAASGFWRKAISLSLLVAIVLIGYGLLSDLLTLDVLADQEASLRELLRTRPTLTYGCAFLIFAGITGLSIPVATVITLLYGWFFGLVGGVILVSFASTAGATLAMLLSRYFFRDAVQRRFGDRLESVNRAMRRDGAYYLFMLCLIPAVPFVVINALMGLTPIRVFTFWWVCQLGMLSGTVLYVYAGASVPSLQALADDGILAAVSPGQLVRIVVAFTLVGVFPLLVRKTFQCFGMTTPAEILEGQPCSEIIS
jgi:uncharacterized membrane protein YdjX (TVP38/TMEM64 family)